MKFISVLIFLPGYIFLAFIYYFPTEWGNKRNVTFGARQWRKRHLFGPFHSIWIYYLLFYVFWPDIVIFLEQEGFLNNQINDISEPTKNG